MIKQIVTEPGDDIGVVMPVSAGRAVPPILRLTEGTRMQTIMRALLDHGGLTQVDLAKRLGVHHTTIAQYSQEKRNNPSVRWLAHVAEECGAEIYMSFPIRARKKMSRAAARARNMSPYSFGERKTVRRPSATPRAYAEAGIAYPGTNATE